MRVVRVRTGIVLDAGGGALARMLTPFKLGVGGPIAGGEQYMPWIHARRPRRHLPRRDRRRGLDGAGQRLGARAGDERDFSRALGRALHRPALAPIPARRIKLLYGDMAQTS